MKNNIDYYQHYANSDQHPKFKMLRVIYGWAGEGRFWALNNRIAQSRNCCLDISKKYNAASIASDLGLTLQEFQNYIECLKNDCELVYESEPGIITTSIIQENFQSVSVNREKARDRKKRFFEKVSKGSPELSKDSPKLSKSSPDQNKRVKESKGKESKVEKRKEDTDTEVSRSDIFVPFTKITSTWNQTLKKHPESTLPQLIKINQNTARHKHTKARWREHPDLETWEKVFKNAILSDFLNGRSSQTRPFVANYDWIVKNNDNFTKVLEGNYKNGKTKNYSKTDDRECVFPEEDPDWLDS